MKKINLSLPDNACMYIKYNPQDNLSDLNTLKRIADEIIPKRYKGKFKLTNNSYEMIVNKNSYVKIYTNGYIVFSGFDKLISEFIINNRVEFYIRK